MSSISYVKLKLCQAQAMSSSSDNFVLGQTSTSVPLQHAPTRYTWLSTLETLSRKTDQQAEAFLLRRMDTCQQQIRQLDLRIDDGESREGLSVAQMMEDRRAWRDYHTRLYNQWEPVHNREWLRRNAALIQRVRNDAFHRRSMDRLSMGDSSGNDNNNRSSSSSDSARGRNSSRSPSRRPSSRSRERRP